MFHYDYKTENTCSQLISLDLDGNVVHNVSFTGDCNGNLKARSRAESILIFGGIKNE